MRLTSALSTCPSDVETNRFFTPIYRIVSTLRIKVFVSSLNMRMRWHLTNSQSYRLHSTLLAKQAAREFCSLTYPQNNPTSNVWKSKLVDSVASIDCSNDYKKRWESAHLEFLTFTW